MGLLQLDAASVTGELLRLALATIFAWAAVGKLLTLNSFRDYLEAIGLTSRAARIGAPGVVVFEITLAVALVTVASTPVGLLTAITFVGFAIVITREQGAPCKCLGHRALGHTSRTSRIGLRIVGAAGGIYIAAAGSPPIELGPRAVWQVVILVLALRVAASMSNAKAAGAPSPVEVPRDSAAQESSDPTRRSSFGGSS